MGSIGHLVAKAHDQGPERRWIKPQCSHNKIRTAVEPLCKDYPLLGLINCKSL